MRILSIETSCDDTGITIMEATGGTTSASFKVLADNLASQTKIHIPYGGVYPMLAKREHIKNLPILLEKSLKEANLTPSPSPHQGEGLRKSIDLIAVTYGPGLEPSLWTGISFAKELAEKWKVPIMPVNHMEGHIVSVFGKNRPARNASHGDAGGGKFKIEKLKTPTLSLLVSGGHTQLVLSKKWMQYEIIGETLDDAVGEAFDKVARMLGLPYPGGPEISRLAEQQRAKEKQYFRGVSQADGPRGSAPRARGDSDPEKISFSMALPRPMLYSKDFNFSFSGLKTAVLYKIRDLKKSGHKLTPATAGRHELITELALEFENAAIECLVHKTAKAIEKYKIKTLIIGGGVAANTHLRRELKAITKKQKALKILFPTPELARDNSIMIGMAGYLNYIRNKRKTPKVATIKATGNLRL